MSDKYSKLLFYIKASPRQQSSFQHVSGHKKKSSKNKMKSAERKDDRENKVPFKRSKTIK